MLMPRTLSAIATTLLTVYKGQNTERSIKKMSDHVINKSTSKNAQVGLKEMLVDRL